MQSTTTSVESNNTLSIHAGRVHYGGTYQKDIMKFNCFWLASIVAFVVFGGTLAAQEKIIADFESDRYDPWLATGECFGAGPAQGTLPGQMHVDGYRGQRLVNSFLKGDGSTGTLTSPEFTIEKNIIAFLIGGGSSDKLALQLIVDGQVERTATGPNDKPGGSETLAQDSWDVQSLKGKVARLRIIDEAKGGWGHINVDHIVQTDKKPPGWQTNVERKLTAEANYLSIPIRNGAPKRVLTLLVDGQQVVRNDIELADGAADWWAPMNVETYRGRQLTLRVDKLPDESAALSSIKQVNQLDQADDLYREALRGQIHFSPKRGWNNDPNGLVFFRGEYHLFFQHNPYGWGWGNMHWGHAVSRDLVHWQGLGDKLMPDQLGPMFSGSAVVDWNNTSGFGKDGQPPLVLIYTAAGNPTVQCLAYSLDGRTFTKFANNPVVKQVTGGNRDPKVFWHEPTKRWVMVLYVEIDKRHTVHFFTSSNLREWQLASQTEGDAVGKRYLYECPDFFELAVDNQASQKKWVLTAANSAYAIGSFDGQRFQAEASDLPGHLGRGFYAAQTFSDIPARDGRRIQIGWLQTETRGMPFNQSMTIPLELKLLSTQAGPRLSFAPVKELETLRGKHHHIETNKLTLSENPLRAVHAELIELQAEFEPKATSEVTFNIRGVDVTYLGATEQLRVGDLLASAPLRGGKQRVTIYADRTGLEIFASDGLCYIPLPKNLDAANQSLSLTASGGEIVVNKLDVYELKSAWSDSK